MDLSEFVKATLVQIATGALDATKELTPLNVRVNPGGGIKRLQIIEFDVAVFASEDSNHSGAAGITVASVIGIGGQKKIARSSGSESRIRFKIPMTLPTS